MLDTLLMDVVGRAVDGYSRWAKGLKPTPSHQASANQKSVARPRQSKSPQRQNTQSAVAIHYHQHSERHIHYHQHR